MTQPHYIDREAVALMVRELDAKAWQSHRIGRGRAKREEHVTYRAARASELNTSLIPTELAEVVRQLTGISG